MKILALIGNDGWVDLYSADKKTYIGGLEKLESIYTCFGKYYELRFSKESSIFVDLIQKGD